MAPTEDDQADERESRVQEIRDMYRRDHPPVANPPQDEPAPPAASIPSRRRGRAGSAVRVGSEPRQ